MARAPIRQISAPRAITPVAAPVDTYVRPAIADRSPLHDLARGLASVQSGIGGLRGFLNKRDQEQEEKDRILGEAAFNKNHQKAWGDAVREGLVPANASPHFMEAYKNAQGNLTGLQLREKFRAEYMAWGGRTEADPEAYGKFVTDFVSRHVQDSDPEVLRSLNKHVESLFSEGYSVFSQERGEATYKGALSTQGALIVETIKGIVEQGEATESGAVDYDAVWNSIVAMREEAVASGVRGDHYDKTMAEAIVAEAVETGNTDLLELFSRKLPGAEHALESLPEFKDLRNKAVEAIQQNRRQAVIDGDRQQTKIDKQREASILKEITRALAADPNQPVPEEAIAELEKYDPMARKKIVETRKAFLDADGDEDPSSLLEIAEAVRGGADEAYLLKKVREGVIRSPQTFQSMMDRVEKYREARAKGSGLIGTPGAKRYIDSIKAHTTPSDLLAADPFGVQGGLTPEGLQATHDFEIMLMEWEANNPNATLVDREKAVQEIGTLILGRIDRSGETPDYVTPGEANQRARDTNQRLQQEEQGGVAIEVDPGATAPGQGPSLTDDGSPWSIQDAYGGEQPPDLGTLPEEHRTHINNEAQRLGVTPEEYNRAMWSKIRELLLGPQNQGGGTAPDGTPVSPGSFQPGGEPGADFDRFVQEPGLVEDTVAAIEKAFGGESGGGLAEGMARMPSSSQSYAALNPSVSQDTLNRLIQIESAGKANAKAPTSSASGLGQFIESTWMATVQKHRPDLLKGRTRAQVLQLRFDPAVAIEMSLRHAEDNIEYLRSKGVPVTDGAIYLAHFAGVGLAASLLRAPRNASAENYFSKAAVRANGSIIRGKTVGQVIEWANRKMSLAGGKDHIGNYMGGGGAVAGGGNVNPAYAKIPDVDGGGRPGQQAKFMEWNPDPIGNHETVLGTVEPSLADVVRRAQQYTGLKFVAASGKRTPEQQAKAVEWGWSHTHDSDHGDGSAVDIWIVEEDGTVSFDAKKLTEVAKAMKRAAKEAGVVIDWGGDWKSKKDRPHFGLKQVTA